LHDTVPSAQMPLPIAAAAWSPAPPAMPMPARRPSACAAAAERRVLCSGDSAMSGKSARGSRMIASISSLQVRRAQSNTAVPEASLGSAMYAPDRR
jgi:hypothetical protein